MLAAPSTSCAFHAVICVGCTSFDCATSAIVLTTDPDVDLTVFELLAARININVGDDRKWSKIVAPLLQRTSLSDTDFKDGDVMITETCEIQLVECKILVPLMKAIVVVLEKGTI